MTEKMNNGRKTQTVGKSKTKAKNDKSQKLSREEKTDE
jgi:hypothetical protein